VSFPMLSLFLRSHLRTFRLFFWRFEDFSHLLHTFLVTPWFSLVYIGFHADIRKIGQQNTHGLNRTLKGMVHLTKFDVSSALK
jgi:hypothetical protein